MENNERFEKVFSLLDSELPKKIGFLNATEPYQYLISVILSAQTTDDMVNRVVPFLFEKFPTSKEMAKGSLEEIETLISKIGLHHMKAKNIKLCSTKIEEYFNGRIPDNMKELVSLPGVGRKTANCILGFIYNKPAVIVDTHFSKVVRRIGGEDVPEIPEKTERYVKKNVLEEHQYRFSMILNYHGRTVCKTRKPNCNDCIVKDLCNFYLNNIGKQENTNI